MRTAKARPASSPKLTTPSPSLEKTRFSMLGSVVEVDIKEVGGATVVVVVVDEVVAGEVDVDNVLVAMSVVSAVSSPQPPIRAMATTVVQSTARWGRVMTQL